MTALPDTVAEYRRTPVFTETTVPAALTDEHATKPGVWAVIAVETGRLEFHDVETGAARVLGAGATAVVAPERRHKVTPLGSVSFHVAFHR